VARTLRVRVAGLNARATPEDAMRSNPLLAFACIASVAAQTPTFRSGVELIEVAVLARDGNGTFVPDLTREDFQIIEQGTPQKITAFDRVAMPVFRATATTAAPPVARDVSTNEHVADARIFVLVLDALHVAPHRSRAVRKYARQFIEQHVGPSDLVAVVSPGGLESATQDFTGDKARLLAAVDQFTGSKLRSATVEIAEEARTGVGNMRARPGSDPSDHERSGRAQSLTNVLEALAKHLERIERRRKTLLLFSEGIDYNQMDVMARTQLNASEVTRALSRAVGALMRTNVSLYSIDPRALSSADGDLVELQGDGVARGVGGLGNSVDQEYGDSIRSLRYVSESTGGFAAVDTNEFTGAFGRIVEESSDYYILGYTPSKPPKPGEFREISVRVSRPDVRVVARKGYTMPAAQRPTVRADAAFEPAPYGPGPSRMPQPRLGERSPAEIATPVAATKGVANDLRTLLASPLPQAGLPMRVQAIPFRGDAKNGTVQLVIEVLGAALQFNERGGRFEERIDLALLTVDANAKADNGRSTTIELRLTPEELQRVKTTGVRWLSRLELAPGHYQVRVAGRAARTGTMGLVTADVDVPKLEPDRPALSGVTITSLTSMLMITKGEAPASALLTTPPSAARTFVAGDQLAAIVHIYVPAAQLDMDLTAHVEWPDGSRNPPMRKKIAGGQQQARSEEVVVPVNTSALAPGRYVLRIALSPSGRQTERIERQVPFDILTVPGR